MFKKTKKRAGCVKMSALSFVWAASMCWRNLEENNLAGEHREITLFD